MMRLHRGSPQEGTAHARHARVLWLLPRSSVAPPAPSAAISRRHRTRPGLHFGVLVEQRRGAHQRPGHTLREARPAPLPAEVEAQPAGVEVIFILPFPSAQHRSRRAARSFRFFKGWLDLPRRTPPCLDPRTPRRTPSLGATSYLLSFYVGVASN
jgi:hypothetical protein